MFLSFKKWQNLSKTTLISLDKEDLQLFCIPIFGYEPNQTNINLFEKHLNLLGLFLDLTYLPIWTEIQSMKQVLHGPNSIDVEVKPYVQILFEEVLNPFYIFQIGSITLWSLDSYYYYASCIAFISLISIIGKSIF